MNMCVFKKKTATKSNKKIRVFLFLCVLLVKRIKSAVDYFILILFVLNYLFILVCGICVCLQFSFLLEITKNKRGLMMICRDLFIKIYLLKSHFLYWEINISYKF
jgi:hypothetical protein